ncbi:cytochrome c oxidase subunit II [Lentibacillus sp. Marseille-P4043]|uniref:cytochrome c oxidase subunit II n=1 Tax=Lentibacillus sp. Marseille-P4043 TaxID=2040293 RepID=UPI000D0B74E1|nr:cytochrome c oxidase subunit II [Lentibacillus sp. Marseille-P4043]
MKRLLLLPIFLLLAGCNITTLNPKSDTASEQSFLIWFSFGLMMIVVVVVFVLFIRFFMKYRYTEAKKDFLPQDVHGNLKLEITWTVLPILLLIILAVPTIAITYDQSPGPKSSEQQEHIDVYVTAQQYLWTFKHENGKEDRNKLVLPAGKPVVFHLKSKDVIHSFWVPALGGKVDVLPGKELTYQINNPQKGSYEGKCAEYCGIGHGDMRFDAEVVAMDVYQQYLARE